MRNTAPIDNLQELFRLTELSTRFPMKDGKPIHKSTFFRWAKVGVCGKKLRTQTIGNRLYTCTEWVNDFLRQDESIDRESQVQAAVAKAEAKGL